MTLKKIVNGQEMDCSDQEEAQIRDFWAFNEKYPLYRDANIHGGESGSFIDIERAKEIHRGHLKKYQEWKIADLNAKIELARENGDSILEKDLMSNRKSTRALCDQDLSYVKKIEDLTLPEDFHFVQSRFTVI